MADQIMQHKADEMAAKQTIPAGYKQTEVGVIPEDWDVVSVSSLISSIWSGVSVNSVDKLNAFSHGMHVLKTSCVSEGGFLPDEKKSILPSDIHRAKCSPAKGDIIVSRMNTPMLVGELGYVPVDIEDSFLPDRLWLMKFKNSEGIDSRWLSWLLSSSTFAKKIKESATGTSGSMKNISKETFLALLVPKPVFKEQETIAKALADIDSLIAGLEQVIAKKQAIKTATMQQLLTGRTRLPQFALRHDGTPKGYKSSELGQIPEDWEVLAIDDCATKVGSGKTPNGGASVYIDAGRPFVRSQNIGWGRLILNDVAYISDDIHNTFPGSEVKEDDVLLNITGASIGRCAITEESIVGGNVNQHVCIIRLNSVRLNARLLVEMINSRKGQQQIDSYQAGGNREGLNFQQVRQLKFSVSNSAVEQTAIATILSDMDSELTALEQKLAKARDLKQGMMQQLLTGRIRLPLAQETTLQEPTPHGL